MVTVIEKEEPGDALPPAYTQTESTTSALSQDVPPNQPPPPAAASSSSSSSSAPSLPLAPPTNYLNISRSNQSIKGTYAIDPSMQMPSSIEPPLDAEGNKLNLRLHSMNGSVNAVVQCIRGPDAKGRVRIETTSLNGSVTIAVHDKSLHRFHLLAVSHNGTVTLRIPSTFSGPVSTFLKNGKLVFSPPVLAHLTTFSEDGHNGRFFLGDYTGSGYENEESWIADALCVEAQNGKVKIEFTDERVEEPSGERKGFFSRFMG